ncbi:hypothetical protein AZF04_02980 [Alkalihalobacillus trypoxylicola]|uniref:MFS transporter n=1 Tax=Alkalihalobacillus trypoxylicola TaxID=519424 RepID=A0A162E5B6_9BACI|nr:hypothetical protein AZF04_02980 [Alkalihalobacillus trypoxylicola]
MVNTIKFLKEKKLTVILLLLVSSVLFVAWFILETRSITYINNQVFLALSLIPFSVALVSFLKIFKIKKDPKLMVLETDERIVAERNEANAKTLKILQVILLLAYLSYTVSNPEDIFKTLGWWVTLCILLLSLFMPLVFRHISRKNY